MKTYILVLTLILGTIGHAETNSFGIYLTTGPVDKRLITRGEGDWSGVRLSEAPLISAADIVNYDFAEQSMKLRPEAVAKIPKPPVDGTPFVVVVNGERIYLGAFVTCLSSRSFAVPSIVVNRQMIAADQPTNVFLVERAYPNPSFGVGVDPRSDSRVRVALAALQKLKVVAGEKPALKSNVPLTIAASHTGELSNKNSWWLSVNSAGRADLMTGIGTRRTRREFVVSLEQIEELRAALVKENFFQLKDQYGEIVPDASTRTIGVVEGSKAKTVRIDFLMNWVRTEPQRLVEPARALRIFNLVRGWFESSEAADLRSYDKLVLEAVDANTNVLTGAESKE